MKQIKWFRNLFLIGASALMLLSVVACKNKAKKNNDPSEFKVEFSAKNPDGVTVEATKLAKLVVAKKGTETITSGTKVAKGTEITFEFVTAEAKGLALKEWTGVADADKTNKSVKVKIEKDTNIVATLKKEATFVVEIHHVVADLVNNTVTIPYGKNEVKATGDVTVKASYYDANGFQGDKDATITVTQATGISATASQEVKIEIGASTGNYDKKELTIKAIAEKDLPNAEIVALKVHGKDWKKSENKVVKVGAANTTIAVGDISDLTIEFTSGVLKGKQLTKTGNASATLIVDSTFAPTVSEAKITSSTVTTLPATAEGTALTIKATYANATIADLTTVKAAAKD